MTYAQELWVKALEGGEFKQGRGTLRSEKDEYCCLGVACEVYRRETGNGEWVLKITGGPTPHRFNVGDESIGSELPYQVRDWLGLKSCSGKLAHKKDEGPTDLIICNDADVESFAQIAQRIRNGEVLQA